MRGKRRFSLVFGAVAGLAVSSALGEGAGMSAGLTLLQTPSARAAALADALTAAPDDIAAFGFNPAALGTLTAGRASLLYEMGPIDDSYGQLMIGAPAAFGGWGLRVGYYDGGAFELFDGQTTRTVTAQTDLVASLGVAARVRGASIGVTAKVITSELIEQERATAYAADLGLQIPVGSRLRIGAAAQNFGTAMVYISEPDPLPRIVRGGVSYLLLPNFYSTSLLADVPYYLNEREWTPSVGVEARAGVLALRAGYRAGMEEEDLTVGMGFALGANALNYSFGFADALENRHRVSLDFAFGGAGPSSAGRAVSAAPARSGRMTLGAMKRTERPKSVANRRRIYVVQPGDTLAGISRRFYNSTRLVDAIMRANAHLIDDPSRIEIGQKIILP